jgi:hypothetical protein
MLVSMVGDPNCILETDFWGLGFSDLSYIYYCEMDMK